MTWAAHFGPPFFGEGREKQEMATRRARKRETLGSWIKTAKDLDGYIARGGKLLDFYLINLSGPFGPVIYTALGEATYNRLRLFFAAVGHAMRMENAGMKEVREVLTEADLRELWRQAA
jgi:hypothetical protein